MVYEKYIKRGGKLHGPYLYRSKKVNGKVITEYLGPAKKNSDGKIENKEFSGKKFNNRTFFLILGLILFFCLIFFINSSLTGKVALEIENNYQSGEEITGNLKMSLRYGELIPASTKIIVDNSGEISEYLLSDLISEELVSNLKVTSGNFYIEDKSISGEGEGYGFLGEKKIYPIIDFELKLKKDDGISDDGDSGEVVEEEIPVVGEEALAPELEVVETEPSIQEDNDIIDNEISSEASENKEPEVVESESAPEESEPAPITGEVVAPKGVPSSTEEKELSEEGKNKIQGQVSKDNDFVYDLEEGDTAEIDPNSVRVDSDKIGDDKIDLEIVSPRDDSGEPQAVVSTNYFILEQGYGEDYLTNEKKTFDIDLTQLGLVAKDGQLIIKLVYDEQELASSNEQINVEKPIEEILNITEKPIEKNITEIKPNVTEIIEVNITKEINITEIVGNITTFQYKAVINRPVKWIKTIKTDKDTDLTIELPKKSNNISIKTGEEVQEALNELQEYEKIIEEVNKTSLITGQVTGEVSLDIEKNQGIITRFFRWLSNFGITGNVISEDEIGDNIVETTDSKMVNVDEILNENNIIGEIDVGVEYYTDAPVAVEEQLKDGKKITINGEDEFEYENILAYTLIEEDILMEDVGKIKLYHYVNEEIDESNASVDSVVINPDSQNESVDIINETQVKVEQNVLEITTKNITEQTSEENITEENITEYSSVLTGNVVGKSADANASDIKEVINLDSQNKSIDVEPDVSGIITNNITEQSKTSLKKERVDFVAHDLDGDDYIDYIEWLVPHLSKQVYDVIYIKKAVHLDENRNFISDIYVELREKDDIWSETINNSHYVRVTFEKPLDNSRIIAIRARTKNDISKVEDYEMSLMDDSDRLDGNKTILNNTKNKISSKIEVYTMDSDKLIATFEDIVDGWYKVYLANLGNESHDVFDLKVVSESPRDDSGEPKGVEFEYIVNPGKVVNDSVVISHLDGIDIDKDFVELRQDYNAEHIYDRIYRDLQSEKRIMEAFGSPMARKTDGEKIIAQWYEQDGLFYNKPNLFDAVVNGTEINVIALNDQPNGNKAGDSVTWNPQLFIDGIEQSVVSGPTLLTIDPEIEELSYNTLEWDYGVCKRRIRIIQGQFFEKWVFAEKPKGTIRIKHNQNGEVKLNLGIGRCTVANLYTLLPVEVVNDDEEILDITNISFPIEIGASATYYPDAHVESTSVDGWIDRDKTQTTWANVIGDSTGSAIDDSGTWMITVIRSGVSSNLWTRNARNIFLFYTASLPDDCTIDAATITIYAGYALDELNIAANWADGIFTSAPASNTALAIGDFDSFGSTLLSNTVDLTTGSKVFTLTAGGRAFISKTSVSKFGMRENYYDALGNVPAWTSDADGMQSHHSYYQREAGSNVPTLVVTYTLATSADGVACNVDADCTNNKCRLGPNTATKYCTSVTDECGCNGCAGYDTGQEVSNDECQLDGTWLCNGGYYNSNPACVVAGDDYWSAEDSDTRTQCIANSGTGGVTTSDEATDCNCDGGYYDDDGGTQSCVQSLAGYYSLTNNDDQAGCGHGNYCPVGSSSATTCPSNNYTISNTSASCTPCLTDYWSKSGSNSSAWCVKYSLFDGSTTNFSHADIKDINSIPNAILENSTYGKIKWLSNVDANLTNFNDNVSFGEGWAYVRSEQMNFTFNTSANITLYYVNLTNPVIMRDGVHCSDCELLANNLNITFNVTGFSNYSVEEAINITLNAPSDVNYSVNFKNVTFNCSAVSGAYNLSNVSLYTDFDGLWGVDAYQTLSGMSNESIFNINLLNSTTFRDEGGFKWNCLIYYNSSWFSAWADSNYTFASWDLGEYNYTRTDGDNVTLYLNDSGQYNQSFGTYTSQVFDEGLIVQWDNFSWTELQTHTTYYNFSVLSDVQAFERNGSLPTNPFDYDVAATSGNYTNINKSDNNRWITAGAISDEYDAQIYLFNITDNVSEILSIEITWEGYGETAAAGYYTNLSIFNWTSYTWSQLNNKNFTSASDDSLVGVVSSNFSDFVNSTTNQTAVMVSTRKALGLGEACTLGAECSSSFCADDVCCNNACTGSICQICNSSSVSGAGTCGYVSSSAQDPDNECTTAAPGSANSCKSPTCSGSSYACGYLAAGEQSQAPCKRCSGASYNPVDVTSNTEDNEGTNLCTGLCVACQSGTCGVANVDSDPDTDCSATDCYTGNCKGGTAECKIYSGGEKAACSTCSYCNDTDYNCDLVADGSDPLGDCSPVGCTNYIYGWSGVNCLKYSGSTASDGDCTGAGACHGVATSCTGAGATSASCGETNCNKACVANAAATSYDTIGEVCYVSYETGSCATHYRCNGAANCEDGESGTSGCISGIPSSCDTYCANAGYSSCVAAWISVPCNNDLYIKACDDVDVDYCKCNNWLWDPVSPFVYGYNGSSYEYISDFIALANSKELEYISFIDITESKVIDNKIMLKMTEELNETTYLNNYYLKIFDYKDEIEFKNYFNENFKVVDPNNWEQIKFDKLDNIIEFEINALEQSEETLKSDDKYLIMEKGFEKELEFEIPALIEGYERKIYFVGEGYYIEYGPVNFVDPVNLFGLGKNVFEEIPRKEIVAVDVDEFVDLFDLEKDSFEGIPRKEIVEEEIAKSQSDLEDNKIVNTLKGTSKETDNKSELNTKENEQVIDDNILSEASEDENVLNLLEDVSEDSDYYKVLYFSEDNLDKENVHKSLYTDYIELKVSTSKMKFQVRSCDDAACDGETFIGPDDTASSYFTTTPVTLSIALTPFNRYFQYKAFFLTDSVNVTPYLENVEGGYNVPSDTCTYGGIRNWDLNCGDYCNITSAVDVLGNNISITGAGKFKIDGVNITNYNNLHIRGTDSSNQCEVYCLNGGCFV